MDETGGDQQVVEFRVLQQAAVRLQAQVEQPVERHRDEAHKGDEPGETHHDIERELP